MRPLAHFKTITHHRHLVRKYCFAVGLYWRGLTHDLSKYSPTEFWRGAKYYQGSFSPTQQERREQGYSLAWMHHKGRNRHHWEYWTDYSIERGGYAPMPMPRRYLAEMLCDRIAASKIYKGKAYDNGAPLAYLMHGKLRDSMHPDTRAALERFLTLLRDEGEDVMFAALRAWVREKP